MNGYMIKSGMYIFFFLETKLSSGSETRDLNENKTTPINPNHPPTEFVY